MKKCYLTGLLIVSTMLLANAGGKVKWVHNDTELQNCYINGEQSQNYIAFCLISGVSESRYLIKNDESGRLKAAMLLTAMVNDYTVEIESPTPVTATCDGGNLISGYSTIHFIHVEKP